MNTTAIVAAILTLSGIILLGTIIDQPENLLGKNLQVSKQVLNENLLETESISFNPHETEQSTETLSQIEIDGLLLMREEEKLARDLYQVLYEKWNISTFANIAQSEQTHTDAIKSLLETYKLSDPVTNDTVGVFKNDNLQSLYNILVQRGNISEIEALKVGALIEDLDIYDLQNFISETNKQDIIAVYENLLRGSRNHMRAFTRQLEIRNSYYEPEYISPDEYKSIIGNSELVPCELMGDGADYIERNC